MAAGRLDLPIGSVTVVGSPFDVSQVPLVAPFRPLLDIEGRPVAPVTRCWAAPRPLVRWGFQLSSFQKVVTKPLAVAQHLDDAEWLAQIEAVDRFTDNMIAYPGRSFGQLYHRFVKGNALAAAGSSSAITGSTVSDQRPGADLRRRHRRDRAGHRCRRFSRCSPAPRRCASRWCPVVTSGC